MSCTHLALRHCGASTAKSSLQNAGSQAVKSLSHSVMSSWEEQHHRLYSLGLSQESFICHSLFSQNTVSQTLLCPSRKKIGFGNLVTFQRLASRDSGETIGTRNLANLPCLSVLFLPARILSPSQMVFSSSSCLHFHRSCCRRLPNF